MVGLTEEAIIERATKIHDEGDCRCDRKYLRSCPKLANAVLVAGKQLREELQAQQNQPKPTHEPDELARLIWETSRADESTISATGANIVSAAIRSSDWLEEIKAKAWDEGWRKGHDYLASDGFDDSSTQNPYRKEAEVSDDKIGPEPIKDYSHDVRELGYEGDG